MAMLRISAARFGLGIAGFCLAIAQGLAQPVTSGNAETLANRLGQTIDAGDANAAFRLAELYRSGEKQVPLDLAKALYLYNTVGSIDLRQDYKQALKWYSKADSLGNVDALNNLGYLHDEGLGTPRGQAKALDYYIMATEAGQAGAQMNLSAYCFVGLGGLRKNLLKAIACAQKAANQAEPGAAEKVTAIKKLMQGGKNNYVP
tara:strand:- start:715 stop:1323 length:609 start_codon:yes stop_codon:yes gene_type:complete